MLSGRLNPTSRKRPKIKPSKLKHFWLGLIFGLFRLVGLSRPLNIGSKIFLHRIVQHTLSYPDIHLSHSASAMLRLQKTFPTRRESTKSTVNLKLKSTAINQKKRFRGRDGRRGVDGAKGNRQTTIQTPSLNN